ncbi:TonB-dependent receptor plug domain-containing protein [Sphingomonas sp. IW22]|uniref:TonB-dependent receptor plug domain-containing protein n=1 Tax=Sphingomonas sp. IW22 TaxID=3242489 RepID=UPI00351FA126
MISFAAFGPVAAYAQDAIPLPCDVEGNRCQIEDHELEHEIVVVGALTDVAIDRDRIELTQANDLADLFRQVPSVSVGGSLGIAQKIYVRGLEDSLLNVTIDGAPQRGTLFHHVGRVTIEPELLESVDVQAGAGEATSGFGAVGGAVRFRTRDPNDLLRPGQSIGGIAKAGWFSNDGYKVSGTLFARLTNDIGILGSYVRIDRENFRDGDGNELLGTSATQELGFVKVGGELGGGHRLSASYELRDEQGAFGQRPNWPVLDGAELFPAEGQRQTAILNYGYRGPDGIGVEATGYWTRSEFTQDRYDRWGLYGAEIETYGFDVRGRLQSGGHDVIAGFEHRNDPSSAGIWATRRCGSPGPGTRRWAGSRSAAG